MVTFKAPTPDPFLWLGRGIAKDRDVIFLSVTSHWVIFHFREDGLQAHDACGVQHSLLAQPACEEGVSRVRLGRSEFAELEALAVQWNKVPVFAFIIREFEGRLRFLFRGQAFEKVSSCPTHFHSWVSGMDKRGREKNNSESEVFLHSVLDLAEVAPD